MGIDRDTVKYLLLDRKIDFNGLNILTIGRMRWYAGARGFRLMRRFSNTKLKSETYSEFFFQSLGAASINSMDFSSYESATIIHNLNMPIDKQFENKFDFVLDSGSLEHIFNCQEALYNYMKMCKLGGDLVLVLPTNNQLGHGLYQFSPEFFFRILSKTSGFVIKRMLLKTDGIFGGWYELKDPLTLGARHEIRTHSRSMLFIHAIKVSEFKQPINIVQSDYDSEVKPQLTKMGNFFLSAPRPIQTFLIKLIIQPRYRFRSFINLRRIRIK